jgi:hypothetical protein
VFSDSLLIRVVLLYKIIFVVVLMQSYSRSARIAT